MIFLDIKQEHRPDAIVLSKDLDQLCETEDNVEQSNNPSQTVSALSIETVASSTRDDITMSNSQHTLTSGINCTGMKMLTGSNQQIMISPISSEKAQRMMSGAESSMSDDTGHEGSQQRDYAASSPSDVTGQGRKCIVLQNEGRERSIDSFHQNTGGTDLGADNAEMNTVDADKVVVRPPSQLPRVVRSTVNGTMIKYIQGQSYKLKQ